MSKPFGYDVTVELSAGFCRTENVQRHFRGTAAAVRRRAMLIPRAKKLLSMEPLTEAEWCRCYGDPRIKSKFS